MLNQSSVGEEQTRQGRHEAREEVEQRGHSRNDARPGQKWRKVNRAERVLSQGRDGEG